MVCTDEQLLGRHGGGYCCRVRDVCARLSLVRRSFGLSVDCPVTGTGIPEPFMLALPPEEGVARRLSLTLESMGTSPPGVPPSAPRPARFNLVGARSLPPRPLRVISANIHIHTAARAPRPTSKLYTKMLTDAN